MDELDELDCSGCLRRVWDFVFGDEMVNAGERDQLLSNAIRSVHQRGHSSLEVPPQRADSAFNTADRPPQRRTALAVRHTLAYLPSDSPSEPLEFRAKYEMGGLIGVGTSSRCHLCVRRSDGRAFACKVIDIKKLSVTHPPNVIKQFRSEITTLRALDHPSIIRLVDDYSSPHALFIVMEYVRGGELFDRIVGEQSLTEIDASVIFAQVASALQYMHHVDVIHRDVKPENILLVSPDSTDIKIIDFGFSKVMHNSSFSQSFMGTGGFLAPELRFAKAYSKPVDVWALGVTLYVMLSGFLPFDAGIDPSPEERYTVAFPEHQWGNVSDGAKDLICNMLRVDPEARWCADEVMMHEWVQAGLAEVHMRRSNNSAALSLERATPLPASVLSVAVDEGATAAFRNPQEDTTPPRAHYAAFANGMGTADSDDERHPLVEKHGRGAFECPSPPFSEEGRAAVPLSPLWMPAIKIDEDAPNAPSSSKQTRAPSAWHAVFDNSGRSRKGMPNVMSTPAGLYKMGRSSTSRSRQSTEHNSGSSTPYMGPLKPRTWRNGALFSRDRKLERTNSLPERQSAHGTSLLDASSVSAHGGQVFSKTGLLGPGFFSVGPDFPLMSPLRLDV